MFWNEGESKKPYQVPDDIVDLTYKISCKCLPLDHAHSLSSAIHKALPWIAENEHAGIHLIHGAESGNGWMRPDNARDELLFLSRRTKLSLRLHKDNLDDARKLTGTSLDVDSYIIEVGDALIKPLSMQSTLFSRYIISSETETEDEFLQRVYNELTGMGIEVSKLLCGKTHVIEGKNSTIFTRSVMLAELKPEHSVKVQQRGIGEGRKMGCGLFIPHKGIAAVSEAEEEPG